MKVQQELMRHADIRTTMNVCGKGIEKRKRDAHGKVVSLVRIVMTAGGEGGIRIR